MSNDRKDPLKRLQAIEKALHALERQQRQELVVTAAELADRLRLGLTGEAAIRHFNDWMTLHGLSYLCVPEDV